MSKNSNARVSGIRTILSSMKKTFVRIASLAFALVAGFAITACTKPETAVEAGIRTQTLHLGNSAEPRDLDPHIITATADYHILFALMGGLTASDPVDSHPIPGVAETWEVSPDGRTWTFHLRANARSSNGDPVVAGDFFYGRRVLSKALRAEYASFLYS